MLVGKFHIIIFSLLAKTGSVGPVEQLIKLVSPNYKKFGRDKIWDKIDPQIIFA